MSIQSRPDRQFPTPVDAASAQRRVTGQLVRLHDARSELPEGVSPAEWALERMRSQNPRIRTFLVCIRLLEDVHDSNYAILHCSPQRLQEIWRQVGRTAKLIGTELSDSLKTPSRIPALEMARRRAQLSLRVLTNTVLVELQRFPSTLATDQMLEVRKLLCVSIGKIHAFLQDTFCQMMAADPRSRHGPDYFLSRRFPRDIEDAEWLHATVERLKSYLESLRSGRFAYLRQLERMLREEQTIAEGVLWDEVATLLEEFQNLLTPQLKEALALNGIRFDEMEVLDRYAFEIPAVCRMLIELNQAAHQVTDEIVARAERRPGSVHQRIEELTSSHAVFARRMASLLTSLDRNFRDLMAFVPLWLESIGLRRALLLKRQFEDDAEDG